MSNYNRGASFERRCARVLREAGWGVIRSSGSHKPCDLAAWYHGRVLMIECKINGRLDPDDWNLFLAIAQQTGAMPVVAKRVGKRIVWMEIFGAKMPGCPSRQPWRAIDPDQAIVVWKKSFDNGSEKV